MTADLSFGFATLRGPVSRSVRQTLKKGSYVKLMRSLDFKRQQALWFDRQSA